MGKNVILVVAILGMMWVAPAFADDDDDFLKGLDAAKAGDMETALKMWNPLADQDYVYAQGIVTLTNRSRRETLVNIFRQLCLQLPKRQMLQRDFPLDEIGLLGGVEGRSYCK
jgi:hypothetical protein